MTKTEKLLRIAKRKGVKVTSSKSVKLFLGRYDYNKHSILLNKNMCPRHMLYILAHELGHAHYKHGSKYIRTYKAAYEYMLANEIAAWNYASRLARRLGFYNKFFIKGRNNGICASYTILKEVWNQ